MSLETDIEEMKRLINGSTNIVAFTGAGISTESGIPDYRGPQGVWTLNPNLQYSKDLSVIDDLKETVEGAEPNNGHKALVKLWEDQRLSYVITQNIDRLHQKAGLPDGMVLELHGSGDNVVAFGQQLDKTTWFNAERASMNCSLMLVLGSSLQVYPAAGLVEVAQKMGADTIIINQQPTDYDKKATLVMRESIGEIMELAGLV